MMSVCTVISCVVGQRCLLWPVHSLGKTLLAFACFTLHSKVNLTCYSRYLLTSYFCIPVSFMKWSGADELVNITIVTTLYHKIKQERPQETWEWGGCSWGWGRSGSWRISRLCRDEGKREILGRADASNIHGQSGATPWKQSLLEDVTEFPDILLGLKSHIVS